MLVIVSVSYILFSLAKPEYFIASYNIHAGSTDSYYLYDLSLDAAPVLAKNGYLDKDDTDYYFSERCRNSYEKMTLRRFNVSVYLAGQAVQSK
jgi:hypothetical protein